MPGNQIPRKDAQEVPSVKIRKIKGSEHCIIFHLLSTSSKLSFKIETSVAIQMRNQTAGGLKVYFLLSEHPCFSLINNKGPWGSPIVAGTLQYLLAGFMVCFVFLSCQKNIPRLAPGHLPCCFWVQRNMSHQQMQHCSQVMAGCSNPSMAAGQNQTLSLQLKYKTFSSVYSLSYENSPYGT